MSSAKLAAQNIKNIAKSKGLSVSKVLKECGLGKDLVSDMIRNNSMPSADKLNKIADYLDVSTKRLLANNENNANEKENGKMERKLTERDMKMLMYFRGKQSVPRIDVLKDFAHDEAAEPRLNRLVAESYFKSSRDTLMDGGGNYKYTLSPKAILAISDYEESVPSNQDGEKAQ